MDRRHDARRPGRLDEIARLLADEHDLRPARPRSEDRLRPGLMERTGGARFRRLANAIEARLRRDEAAGVVGRFSRHRWPPARLTPRLRIVSPERLERA